MYGRTNDLYTTILQANLSNYENSIIHYIYVNTLLEQRISVTCSLNAFFTRIKTTCTTYYINDSVWKVNQTYTLVLQPLNENKLTIR